MLGITGLSFRVCSFTHESSPGRGKLTGDFLIIDWECRNPLERPLTPLFPFWDKWNAVNLQQCKTKKLGEIEDITWSHRDKEFLFKCSIYFSTVEEESHISRWSCNVP